MSIKINHKIPATMSLAGLEYLGSLARTVPENGVIVEVGPLFGSSTWVLSKNAHPSVTIYSIDTWDPAPWIDKLEEKYPNCKPFSIEAFKFYTQDCPNVVALQGWSPDIVEKTWDKNIDLFFDDATHGNPGFTDNINFFLPWVKTGGIICGDDYARRWTDIVKEVDALGEKWSVNPEIIGRVWALIKPDESNVSPTVYSTLEHSDHPELLVTTTTNSGKRYPSQPGCWSGALHKNDPIKSIEITSVNAQSTDLDVEIQYQLTDGSMSKPVHLNENYDVPQGMQLVGLSGKLKGKDRLKFDLSYQIGFCNMTKRGLYPEPSGKMYNGNLLKAEDDDYAINAIQVAVKPKIDEIKSLASRVYNKVAGKIIR